MRFLFAQVANESVSFKKALGSVCAEKKGRTGIERGGTRDWRYVYRGECDAHMLSAETFFTFLVIYEYSNVACKCFEKLNALIQ